MPTVPSDSQLIEQLGQGDEDAYETLHGRYAAPLCGYLLRLVHDPAVADDLLQETFLRLWTRAAQWSGAGAVKSWLFSIARNLAFNHLDSRRRRRQQPLEIPVDDGTDEEFTSPGWLADRNTPAADAPHGKNPARGLYLPPHARINIIGKGQPPLEAKYRRLRKAAGRGFSGPTGLQRLNQRLSALRHPSHTGFR